MGGSAKVVKNAVAPARRKGSFCLNSLKASVNILHKPFIVTLCISKFSNYTGNKKAGKNLFFLPA